MFLSLHTFWQTKRIHQLLSGETTTLFTAGDKLSIFTFNTLLRIFLMWALPKRKTTDKEQTINQGKTPVKYMVLSHDFRDCRQKCFTLFGYVVLGNINWCILLCSRKICAYIGISCYVAEKLNVIMVSLMRYNKTVIFSFHINVFPYVWFINTIHVIYLHYYMFPENHVVLQVKLQLYA